MSYYDEEFYREPSEFEQEIDQFKMSLLNAVKTEFVDEMERLRKENAELQAIKKGFDKIRIDYKNKENVLESERMSLERKIRNERITDLFKNHEVIMFVADSERIYLPKCDKCNEKRRIEFITPLGRKSDESCECNKSKSIHKPSEYIRTEFRYDDYGRKMTVWYKPYDKDRDGYSSGSIPNSIYQKGMSFEEVDKSYYTYFSDPNDCQLYCDYLNEKEVFA